ncbi:MAG: cob(I)yrinic acid a,c-diamide adenosyltransferase [Burkholderiales bacterium]|nr:cob(I)yrinic acid a,c-diamide adenosyltransferase [Burkholderiales bacterium]
MGHRLSKIVTRTGDDGTTGLGDGARVAKDAPRIAAMGDIDELNSAIGCVLTGAVPEPVRVALAAVQNDLFDLGGEVCIPGREAMADRHLAMLDDAIAALNAGLPPLREFVLPGGDPAAAACHLARAICRRAERSLVALSHREPVSSRAMCYLNRLSDLLFVSARVINRARARHETTWNPGEAVKAP